jgi:hypothetical protein
MAALRRRFFVKPETGGVVELDGLHFGRHPFGPAGLGDMTYVVSPAVTR